MIVNVPGLLQSRVMATRNLAEALCCVLWGAVLSLSGAEFHRQAVRESLEPIRPGVPGKAPFWNEQAKQFIWAPAFNFTNVAGARSYRFTLDGAGAKPLTFVAKQPWAPLTPIWADAPVGPVVLKVEGLAADGKVAGVAGERKFHRGAVFNGPYGKPMVSYAESARTALDGIMVEPFIRKWAETGKPDPDYGLYRYASKLIGAVMSASAWHARQSGSPEGQAQESIKVGRSAADFLLSVSCPSGSPLEYFPPTYRGAKPGERENDNWTMLISPAEAGQGYLNLYDATGDTKYLEAARRIGATYRKTQLPGGTWPLKVDNRTGKPIAENELIPSVVISFLDRLVSHYQTFELRPVLNCAVQWMLNNPVRSFDWSAQFDDARLRKPYQNLSKHEACEFAAYLFAQARRNSKKTAIALELLRFAEDQFVIWEQPPHLKTRAANLEPENWFLPCSAEQYAMFEPISGSSAFMIMAYVEAFRTTGDRLHLAKAESLANALTEAQQYHKGRLPTRMVRKDPIYWVNSSVNTIRALCWLEAARQEVR